MAYIHQERGEDQLASQLLTKALAVVRSTPRLGKAGHGVRDVQILALQGRAVEALDTFQQAIEEGFRGTLSYDNWFLERDPYLNNIREHPRFSALIAQIEDFNMAMLATVRQAERSNSWDELRAKAAAEG